MFENDLEIFWVRPVVIGVLVIIHVVLLTWAIKKDDGKKKK